MHFAVCITVTPVIPDGLHPTEACFRLQVLGPMGLMLASFQKSFNKDTWLAIPDGVLVQCRWARNGQNRATHASTSMW